MDLEGEREEKKRGKEERKRERKKERKRKGKEKKKKKRKKEQKKKRKTNQQKKNQQKKNQKNSGKVAIEVEVSEPSKYIVLNSYGLILDNVIFEPSSSSSQIKSTILNYDEM